MSSVVACVALGGLYGLMFALLAAKPATSPGAGLLWGLSYALVLRRLGIWSVDGTG